jgi:hypothetical protein
VSGRTRKMVNLAIEETSGVDHPAHLAEGWLVLKAADPNSVLAVVESGDEPDLLKSEEAQEAPMEKSVEEQLEEATKALSAAEARIADLEGASSEPTEDEEDDMEKMLKSAPEPVRKALEDAQRIADEAVAKAADAEASLRKEREDRADAEAVEKARTAFEALGLDAAVVGPALRRLSESDEPLAKAVESALLAANAKVEASDIFAEIGSPATAFTGSAYQKAESLAKAAVSAGTATTIEQAMTDVLTSDPSLYTAYLAEKKG